jgi:hypothetical protein
MSTTTYYGNGYLSRDKIDFSKATKLIRGDEQMDTLLFDLLTTVSPNGREDAISKIILDYASKNVKQFQVIEDKEVKNLIIQIGSSNAMFSSHMDTVQRTARKTNDLYITEDNYIYAGYPKRKRMYFNKKKENISQFEMEKEAEEKGYDFSNYVMHNGSLYGSDDDFDGWENTGLKYKFEDTIAPSETILGADDKLGCYIMCRMMKEGISGLYVFHIGEENGGIGSTHLSENRVELFKTIDYCVAFDRKGYNDVIYRQSGGQCCSNQFASAVCDEMNNYLPPKEKASPSPNGSFTDSANYTHLISECTNLPVGYFDQHSSDERFDLEWLERYAIPAYLNMPWTDLPVKRAPQKQIPYGYGGGFAWQNRYSSSSLFETEDEHYDGVPVNSSSVVNKVNRAKNKTRRNPNQSSLDKIEYQMNQLEDFDVSTGFAEEESHGQRVKRVLYSMITSNLTLEEIAELVVDTYDSAKDSDDSFLEF